MPPRCAKCKGVFKPDCVFFGEAIPVQALTRAHQESRTCDLMLVLGTIDLGMGFKTYIGLTNAAREAARYAAVNDSRKPTCDCAGL